MQVDVKTLLRAHHALLKDIASIVGWIYIGITYLVSGITIYNLGTEDREYTYHLCGFLLSNQS